MPWLCSPLMNDWEVKRLISILKKPLSQVSVAEMMFVGAMRDKRMDATDEQKKQIADLIGITVDELGDADL